VTGTFNVDAFKIVYIVSMKAPVQEMVGNFTKQVSWFGIQVGKLTGDAQMIKVQILTTQIITMTLEK
jgi:pre-mRNA-splicing helicase BRR2